jgi:hypothetical protein
VKGFLCVLLKVRRVKDIDFVVKLRRAASAPGEKRFFMCEKIEIDLDPPPPFGHPHLTAL